MFLSKEESYCEESENFAWGDNLSKLCTLCITFSWPLCTVCYVLLTPALFVVCTPDPWHNVRYPLPPTVRVTYACPFLTHTVHPYRHPNIMLYQLWAQNYWSLNSVQGIVSYDLHYTPVPCTAFIFLSLYTLSYILYLLYILLLTSALYLLIYIIRLTHAKAKLYIILLTPALYTYV